jgi:phosphocarrier protein
LQATRTITILNKYGLHVRPSVKFSQTVQAFKSKVTVATPEGHTADGSSILGLLSLGLRAGESITVTAEGEDAQQVADALCALSQNQFDMKYDE